jgi:phenylalanine-4-hydroxylase
VFMPQAPVRTPAPAGVQPHPMFDLPADHPGFSDEVYRRRRSQIAAIGAAYQPGTPIPEVEYTPEEDALWRLVSTELATKHQQFACAEYLDAASRLRLPADAVPQLGEVTDALQPLTGWRVEPVPGLVPIRDFYGSLATRRFCSTQYVRHHSVPFYTPEPDIVHEIIGHANALASPVFAGLYELAGLASLRATTEEALERFSKVFWFTIEFGVVYEDGELRTYGAGILSSFGELDSFRQAEIRPWDIEEMAATPYDITRYQPVLFAAPSFAEMVERLSAFFDSVR